MNYKLPPLPSGQSAPVKKIDISIQMDEMLANNNAPLQIKQPTKNNKHQHLDKKKKFKNKSRIMKSNK